MCGFAGYFASHTSRAALSAPQVSSMLERLRARGPDAQHVVGWSRADDRLSDEGPFRSALIHARLSIIDPTPEADQPMQSDDGEVWICFNGEVYDWQADAAVLKQQGVNFRTRSDTEFILRAYEQWGFPTLLGKLRGMYAFAIYDRRLQKVFLARDPMGKKPLLFHLERQGVQGAVLSFGSTLRALLPSIQPEKRKFSPQSIDAFLTHRTIPAPLTLMEGVERLPNGGWLEFDLQTGAFCQGVQASPTPSVFDWQQTLEQAVARRLVADRPLGLFLSGGIDSAVIASVIAKIRKGDVAALEAYTASFPGSTLDEAPTAAWVANLLGIRHRIVEIPQSIEGDFERIVADMDEPFADPSLIPLWYLSREATKSVKVVLSGDGGDELFAGYKRYAKHLRSQWRRGVRMPLSQWTPSVKTAGWTKLRTELALSWVDAYVLRFSGLDPCQRTFLQPDFSPIQIHYWRRPVSSNGHDSSPMAQLLDLDMLNYLPEYILRKGDLTTMAHGLELRSPMLDLDFYRSVLGLPKATRFTDPPKQIFQQVLPQAVTEKLFGEKKKGFNPPLHDWLKISLRDRLMDLPGHLERLTQGQISAAAVTAFLDRYRAGDNSMAETIFQLLMLGEAMRQLSALIKE